MVSRSRSQHDTIRLENESANCDYGLVGLMGEWVLGELLEDLKRENMTAEASALEATMRYRANLWEIQAVPFGSEMAWDSTGQEGVYYWTKYDSRPLAVLPPSSS